MEKTFAALGDPTRLAVIDLLRNKPHRAGELASALQMSAPALSRHLRVLRKSGLIAEDAVDSDARVRLYRLEPAAFATIREWLTEVGAFRDGQLDAFKAHAESASEGSAG